MTTFSFRGLNPLANPAYHRERALQQLVEIEKLLKILEKKNPPFSLNLQKRLYELIEMVRDDDILRSASQQGSTKIPTHVPRWLREEIEELLTTTQNTLSRYTGM